MADGALRWAGRRRRAGLVAAASALAAAGIAAAVAARLAAPAAPAPGGIRLTTVPVVRTSLTTSIQVAGALGYAGSFAAVDELAGTAYTILPAPGTMVRRGQRLYEVDGRPVVLFYGTRPEWRDLAEGVPAGPDISQLNANLAALGYGAAGGAAFTAATAYAVGRWQVALGLPVTGTVPAGQIAYAPGPLRVASVLAGLGAPAQPGSTVLTATSPGPVVRAAVPVAQEYLVRAGDQVTVTLPSGAAVPGTVLAVARVASAARGGPDDGSGPSDQLTVEATVGLTRAGTAAGLDQAPVTVSIVSARARRVLAVPVNALVALAGGGYAVQVPRPRGGPRLVAVRAGLFGGSLVQVSGALRPGMRVMVPAP
jgi:peptidoglycan hydrolase-like protein with peptidoglycan-binding domain